MNESNLYLEKIWNFICQISLLFFQKVKYISFNVLLVLGLLYIFVYILKCGRDVPVNIYLSDILFIIYLTQLKHRNSNIILPYIYWFCLYFFKALPVLYKSGKKIYIWFSIIPVLEDVNENEIFKLKCFEINSYYMRKKK